MYCRWWVFSPFIILLWATLFWNCSKMNYHKSLWGLTCFHTELLSFNLNENNEMINIPPAILFPPFVALLWSFLGKHTLMNYIHKYLYYGFHEISKCLRLNIWCFLWIIINVCEVCKALHSDFYSHNASAFLN